jgi:hypothetical protein
MVWERVIEGEVGERGLLLRRVRAQGRVCQAGVRPPEPTDGAGALEHDRLEARVDEPARARQARGAGSDDRNSLRHQSSIGRTLVG